jgi:hypothetical protein
VILEPVPQPDQLLEQKQARALVSQALAGLRARDERVVRLRYGVGCEPETLGEVGARLGICAQRVRQVEQDALRRLRHPARARPLGEAAEVLLGRPAPQPVPTPAPPRWREQWAAARRPRPPEPPTWEQVVRPPVPAPPPRPPARIRPATAEDYQWAQSVGGGVLLDETGTYWECERISDGGPAAYFQWREQQL